MYKLAEAIIDDLEDALDEFNVDVSYDGIIGDDYDGHEMCFVIDFDYNDLGGDFDEMYNAIESVAEDWDMGWDQSGESFELSIDLDDLDDEWTEDIPCMNGDDDD